MAVVSVISVETCHASEWLKMALTPCSLPQSFSPVPEQWNGASLACKTCLSYDWRQACMVHSRAFTLLWRKE